VLQVIHGDSSAYHRANDLYHAKLFKFADAFAVDHIVWSSIPRTLPPSVAVPSGILRLHEIMASQPEDFTVDWPFAGTKHFISNHEILVPHRTWLLQFFEALEGANRQAILVALQQARAHFQPF
jgi:hypothetical protein